MAELVIAQGTTPTYMITVPFDTSTLQKAQVTFTQDGRLVLKKTDLILSGTTVSVSLTQEETFLFYAGRPAECQLRVKTAEGKARASYAINMKVRRSLDREVL